MRHEEASLKQRRPHQHKTRRNAKRICQGNRRQLDCKLLVAAAKPCGSPADPMSNSFFAGESIVTPFWFLEYFEGFGVWSLDRAYGPATACRIIFPRKAPEASLLLWQCLYVQHHQRPDLKGGIWAKPLTRSRKIG